MKIIRKSNESLYGKIHKELSEIIPEVTRIEERKKHLWNLITSVKVKKNEWNWALYYNSVGFELILEIYNLEYEKELIGICKKYEYYFDCIYIRDIKRD